MKLGEETHQIRDIDSGQTDDLLYASNGWSVAFVDFLYLLPHDYFSLRCSFYSFSATFDFATTTKRSVLKFIRLLNGCNFQKKKPKRLEY